MLKDSGERREFETGAVRDIADGKGRCDLLPLGVIGEILGDDILLKIEQYIRTGEKTLLYYVLAIFLRDHIKGGWYDMFLDVAKQYEDGAKKYSDRNWEKGMPLHCYIDSGVRHYLKFKRGDDDEPHGRAFVWNILGAIWTQQNKPEMIDLPFKEWGKCDRFFIDDGGQCSAPSCWDTDKRDYRIGVKCGGDKAKCCLSDQYT